MGGPGGQPRRGFRIERVDVSDERRLVRLRPPGEQRADDGHPRAPSQIADHVQQRGGVAHADPRNRGEPDGVERHEDESRAEPLDEPGPCQCPVVHPAREHRHIPGRPCVQDAAHGKDEPLVHFIDEPAGENEREEIAHAAGRQHQSRRPRVVAEHLLGEESQKDHAREEPEHDEDHDDAGRREVAVPIDAKVEDGLLRGELAHEKAYQGHRGGEPEHDDEARVEPLVALALVEKELEGQEADHHEAEPGDVDLARLAQVRRVEQDGAGGKKADDADREVDVEGPAPRPVVGDPPAERRPEDRGHHDPHAPHGHRHAALPEREDLPHDRLG